VAPPSEVGSPSEMVCPPSEMVWLLESVVGLEDVWGLLKVLGLGAWRVQKCWLVVEGPGPVWIRVGRMVLRVLDAEGHGILCCKDGGIGGGHFWHDTLLWKNSMVSVMCVADVAVT
jgi:hypothetical protein